MKPSFFKWLKVVDIFTREVSWNPIVSGAHQWTVLMCQRRMEWFLLSVQSQMVVTFESFAIYSWNNNIKEHFIKK